VHINIIWSQVLWLVSGAEASKGVHSQTKALPARGMRQLQHPEWHGALWLPSYKCEWHCLSNVTLQCICEPAVRLDAAGVRCACRHERCCDSCESAWAAWVQAFVLYCMACLGHVSEANGAPPPFCKALLPAQRTPRIACNRHQYQQ